MIHTTITRFNRTRAGYTRFDTGEFEVGEQTEAALNMLMQNFVLGYLANEPAAYSFGSWKAGKMSGETWRSASAIVLEYLVGDPEAFKGRLGEIGRAADRLNLGYLLLDTCTRDGERTISLVFPLAEAVGREQYARIASVLSERLWLWRAAPGVKAMTHLVHIHPGSSCAWFDGAVIKPGTFIKETAKLAQNLDPCRFERSGPRPSDVQLTSPTVTADHAAEEGLFEGL